MGHLLRTSSYGAGAYLFLNEELSDVVIIVKTCAFPWRFPAHRLILSAQSRVFRCMLQGDFAENSNKEIIIEDINPSTVECLLRYMYYGRTEMENWKEAIDLLKAAHKYQIDPLVEMCGKFLENVITLSNVCYLFDESTTYNLPSMREKCLRLILDAGFVVLKSKAFEILSKECVLEIVASSNLNIDSELTVFEALLRWAPMQCCRTGKEVTETNILFELQPFLPHVCFDDMSDTDKSALPSSILSCVRPNNRNRILFTISPTLLPHSHRLRFKVDHATASTTQIAYPHRYEFENDDIEITVIRGEGLVCMRFSVDTPIYLIGLSFVMLSRETPTQLPLLLKKENNSNTVISSFNVGSARWKEGIFVNERTEFDTEIILRQPVKLEEKTVYKLLMNSYITLNVQCFKTRLVNETIFGSSGHAHFTVHSETWGITSLTFMSA